MRTIALKQITENYKAPMFVYSEKQLVKNIKRIKGAILNSGIKNKVKINVSYFANSNPHIASILSKLNVGLTIQSIEEIEQLKKFNVVINKIVSPTHLSDDDLSMFLQEGLLINVSTISNLREILEKDVGKICIRIDLSPESNQRNGIHYSQFGEVRRLLDKYSRKLYGIHIYIGTGSNLESHLKYQKRILEFYELFPEIREINLGGGFGFDYSEEENEKQHFNWNKYFKELNKNIINHSINSRVQFTIEPGRDVLADTGYFLVAVVAVERRGDFGNYEIFTNGSYVHMPSATIKARRHKLNFYNKHFAEIKDSDMLEGFISGSTTLSSDRILPLLIDFPRSLQAGDFILIRDIGAYGATQHMEFLNKRPLGEFLIRANRKIEVISKIGELADRVRNVPLSPIVIN